MSDILLDFVDRLVGDDNNENENEKEEITTFLSATNNMNNTAVVVVDEYCTLPPEVFDNFTAKEFNNTSIIDWMHSFPPRFGKTNNIMALLIGSEDEQKGTYRSM